MSHSPVKDKERQKPALASSRSSSETSQSLIYGRFATQPLSPTKDVPEETLDPSLITKKAVEHFGNFSPFSDFSFRPFLEEEGVHELDFDSPAVEWNPVMSVYFSFWS